MVIKSYKDLVIWKKGIELSLLIFEITKKYPAEERFGLAAQMRSCAFSIPSNIAEGFARRSRLEFLQFLKIAYGSAAELETQLLISFQTRLLGENEFQKANLLIVEILKMINTLLTKHRRKS